MSIDVEGQLSGREYDLKFLLKYAIDRKSCRQHVNELMMVWAVSHLNSN